MKHRFGELGWRNFYSGETPVANKKEKEPELQQSLDVASKPASKAAVSPVAPGNLAARLSPAAHKQATTPPPIEDTFTHDTAFHMAFLGAGQGGSRIANSFWEIGYRRVGIFNTTESDFEGLDVEIPKLSLDIGGAAKNMQFAREALAGRDEEVWDLMSRSWGKTPDCALICVGLGGGSGSGTALPLLQLARKYMEAHGRPPRVGCIVSLPSSDEGQVVCRNAVQAFRELYAAKASPLIIIDNARVHRLYNPPMSKLLPKSNELVSQLFHLFNTLAATKSPHMTFDRSEFAQLLDGGVVVMGAADIGHVEAPADVSKKIKEDLTNSVLAEVDLRYGKKAACLFVGSQDVLDSLSLDYFSAGFNMLDRIVGSAYGERTDQAATVIHRGLYSSAEPGLQCYTMVSELRPPLARLADLAKKGGLAVGTTGSGIAHHFGLND